MRASEATLLRWRFEPWTFVRECFGATPDPWQDEALHAWNDNQRLALKACKGPGKTALEAWLGWNWLLTRPFSQVFATSITGQNLRDNLCKEMSTWQQKSQILTEAFEWGTKRIVHKSSPGNWFMTARTWEKSADKNQQSESLAGAHADYILFILDEVSGIPDAVANTAEGALATGIESKILIAGNPSLLTGPLFRAFNTEKKLWYGIEITADPEDPKRTTRVSRDWALQQIAKWGPTNPWVLVNVFGKFPPASINALLGRPEIETAMLRKLDPEAYMHAQRRIGVDVAWYGDDSSVIVSRQGLKAKLMGQHRHLSTTQLMTQVMLAINATSSEMEFVDGTGGWGNGLVDALIGAGRAPLAVISNSKANDEQFFNLRSEMYWNMAKWVQRGGALEYDQDLMEEIEACTTYYYQGNKIRILEKQQVKEKLGRSPDKSDALALTFAIPELKTMFPEADATGLDPATYQNFLRGQRGPQIADHDPMEQTRAGELGDFGNDPMRSNF